MGLEKPGANALCQAILIAQVFTVGNVFGLARVERARDLSFPRFPFLWGQRAPSHEELAWGRPGLLGALTLGMVFPRRSLIPLTKWTA